MGLGHGENEVGTDSGVSASIRPASRAQAGQAQPDHQAPKDAHLQVGAGQTQGLVGHPDQNDRNEGRVWPTRPPSLANLRAAGLLVPLKAQSQGDSRPRPRLRRLRNHVSRRISALRRLLPRPFGPRRPRVPHETDETGGNLALRAGSSVQSGLQTTRPRSGGPDIEVSPAADRPSNHPDRRSVLAGLCLMAGCWLIEKANVPVKIGRGVLHHRSCEPEFLKFSTREESGGKVFHGTRS